MVEATDTLGKMVVAVLGDQAAVMGMLQHPSPLSMAHVKSSRALYSSMVAMVQQTRCASRWRRSNSLLD